ncbi:Helix-turn-helix domain-containing protein [Methylobacterium sp. 190mf]|nr:Helix-turn-helix domain-containing protein [Methylobacterium sp. 190mf]
MRTVKTLPPGELPLDRKETARRLGVSPSFLDKARANGEGPAVYKFGRRCVYRAKDVEAYAEAHRVDPSVPSSEGGRA